MLAVVEEDERCWRGVASHGDVIGWHALDDDHSALTMPRGRPGFRWLALPPCLSWAVHQSTALVSAKVLGFLGRYVHLTSKAVTALPQDVGWGVAAIQIGSRKPRSRPLIFDRPNTASWQLETRGKVILA